MVDAPRCDAAPAGPAGGAADCAGWAGCATAVVEALVDAVVWVSADAASLPRGSIAVSVGIGRNESSANEQLLASAATATAKTRGHDIDMLASDHPKAAQNARTAMESLWLPAGAPPGDLTRRRGGRTSRIGGSESRHL
jgi:hypothetical protein